MAKFFKYYNRIFKLDIKRFKEMRRNGRNIKYYIKPFNDERNSLAKGLDFYGPLIILIVLTWLAIRITIGSNFKAVIVSIFITAIELYGAFHLREFFRGMAQTHKKRWSEGRRCQEKIKKLKSEYQLVELVAEILGKIPGFSNVEIIANKEKSEMRSIPLQAVLKNELIAVDFIMPETKVKGDISSDAVLESREKMLNNGYSVGIIVTTGYFTGDAKRAALENRKKIRIALVDIYMLVDLARETNHIIFKPTEPEELKGSDRSLGYKAISRSIFSKDKVKGYWLSSGLLMIMLFLFRTSESIILIYVYSLFAAVNFLLGFYCLISNRENNLLNMIKTK